MTHPKETPEEVRQRMVATLDRLRDMAADGQLNALAFAASMKDQRDMYGVFNFDPNLIAAVAKLNYMVAETAVRNDRDVDD